jgi:hypothetical protein
MKKGQATLTLREPGGSQSAVTRVTAQTQELLAAVAVDCGVVILTTPERSALVELIYALANLLGEPPPEGI